MTVVHLGNQKYIGLEADTKPTNATTNAELWETDSGKIFVYSGTAWLPRTTRSFGTQVWRENITPFKYYVQNSDGEIIGSGAGGTAALITAIQDALNLKGEIIFHPAEYDLTYSGFTGFNVSSDTTITQHANSFMSVRNGFANAVWKITAATEADHKKGIIIQGGAYFEAGASPLSDWDIVLMEVSDNVFPGAGIFQNTIRNIYTKYPKIGIHLKQSGTEGFINSNTFENIWINYPEVGVLFEAVQYAYLADGIHENRFLNCTIQEEQAGTHPLDTGFKNIGGVGNSFEGCIVWDVHGSAVSSNIITNGINTLIVGGDMTRFPVGWDIVADKGENTIVLHNERNGPGTSGLLTDPFVKKMGIWNGTGSASTTTTGDGIFNNLAGASSGSGTLATGLDATGLFKQLSTTATINTRIAIRSQSACAARAMNIFFKIKAGLNQLSDTRFIAGIISNDPVMTGDDPVNALHCVAIAYSSTSAVSPTNWLFIHNDGTGATITENTGIAATTGLHNFYIATIDSVPKVGCRIDGNNAMFATTEMPGQYTGLFPGLWLSNVTANIKTANAHAMFIKMDGK